MNTTCFMLSLFSTPHIYPFRSMFITRISLRGPPRGLERKEAHPELDQPFDEAMVLFHDVVEVVLATWDICSKKSINNGSTQSFSPTGQSLSPQLYSSNQSFDKNAMFSSPQLYCS
jgi:hypothetical protein